MYVFEHGSLFFSGQRVRATDRSSTVSPGLSIACMYVCVCVCVHIYYFCTLVSGSRFGCSFANQDTLRTYTVELRRVRVNTVIVEKQ